VNWPFIPVIIPALVLPSPHRIEAL